MGRRSIGEAARELGVSIDTLRLYERRELLLAPVRRDAAQRRWYDDDLEWIETCLYLRGTGMSLADVARYAALVRAGDGTEPQRLALLRAHLDGVTRRLAEVQGWADAVAHKVRYYEAVVAGGANACAVAAPTAG